MFHSVKKCFSVLCLPALLVLGTAESIQIAASSCSVGWPIGDPTCIVVDGVDHFEYTLHTNFASFFKGAWTLAFAMGAPQGGITNHAVSPTSVNINDGGTSTSGEISTACSGTMSESSNRTSQCNAVDVTGFECSGGRNITVKPSGSC